MTEITRRTLTAGLASAAAPRLLPLSAATGVSTFAIAQRALPELRLTDQDAGLERVVTVESAGQFRLVFEARDNWGLDQWYDLVHDPKASNNLLKGDLHLNPDGIDPALFQQVYYGTEPDDPKLYCTESYHYFPKTPRSFVILERSPARIVVEATSQPIAAAIAVLKNVTVTVRTTIHPDGLLRIRATTRVIERQAIKTWVCGIVGLCDPTSRVAVTPPDKAGWIRASPTQQPFTYTNHVEPHLFAYWGTDTPAPYRDWTKASVLIAPLRGELMPDRHFPHNWAGFKRWGYARDNVVIPAGGSVTQEYVIQLGTDGSDVLPSIRSKPVAADIMRRARERLG